MSHKGSQRYELTLAVGATLLGLAGLFVALTAPLYQTSSMTITTEGERVSEQGTASVLEVGVEPRAIVFLGAAVTALIFVSLGAYLQTRRGMRAGRWLLWAAVIFLAGFALLGAMTIGLFMLPGLLLAIISAVISGDREAERGT